MEPAVINATEYRNISLSLLTESTTNPRRIFEDESLKELAESIRAKGVLSPLLVRPLNERSFEIVSGARRFRAAQMAEAATVPVRIVNLTDSEALEAQLIENLQRRDVHPLEEAQGFRALLNLEEPKYSIEQIAAKTGKTPSYVAQRLKLTEVLPTVAEAFFADEIGVGHALLLAKLPHDEQEKALAQCFREDWAGGGGKPKRILLPVRHLQQWIEHQLMLNLKLAPFNTRDAQLVSSAGSCIDCQKRTGHNKLLFADVQQNACTDPACYAAKVEAHVRRAIAGNPNLVQISTAYGRQADGNAALPRNKYVEIRVEKPQNKYQREAPEYKTCKHTAEAIVTEGSEKGEIRKVCAAPDCPIHHPKRMPNKADAGFKAEQEKRRREEAIANATGLRVLKAIGDAVPVRLMKRDLLFVTERLIVMLDEPRLSILIRQHGMGKPKDGEAPIKLLAAFLRKAEESTLGRLLVEAVILIATRTESNSAKRLREAAQVYKVDVEAITAKVRQEFAIKEKARAAKPQPKAAKKTAA